jgi:prepilin-type processing-associated H-X9-DG protein
VKLTQAGGQWLILPPPDLNKVQPTDVVNAVAYVLSNPQVFDQARDTARSVSCLSNLKQVCVGILMYAQDFDEVLKFKATTYEKSIDPYVKNPAVFKCPADASGRSAYNFNPALAGVNSSTLKAPAQTVMVYEGRNGKLDFRHNGKAAVGFADGHCKLVTAAEAKALRWKP